MFMWVSYHLLNKVSCLDLCTLNHDTWGTEVRSPDDKRLAACENPGSMTGNLKANDGKHKSISNSRNSSRQGLNGEQQMLTV